MKIVANVVLCVIMVFSFFIGGCGPASREIETAIHQGQTVTVTNNLGTLKITAGEGFKRTYSLNDETLKITLSGDYERSGGSLGLRRQGGMWQWEPGPGLYRAFIHEDQMHFETEEQALAWLKLPYNCAFIYTNDGLVVDFYQIPFVERFNISLHQIYIGGTVLSKYQGVNTPRIWCLNPDDLPDILKELNKKPVYIGGHKPQNLSGSQDDKIKVE